MAEPLTALRDARHTAGMSQQELAKRCGMSYAQISKLERGVLDVLNIRVGNLWALADTLHVDPSVLVGDRRKIIKKES